MSDPFKETTKQSSVTKLQMLVWEEQNVNRERGPKSSVNCRQICFHLFPTIFSFALLRA